MLKSHWPSTKWKRASLVPIYTPDFKRHCETSVSFPRAQKTTITAKVSLGIQPPLIAPGRFGISGGSDERRLCSQARPVLELKPFGLHEILTTNPNVSFIEPFHWVMEWKDIITQQHFISLLEKHFFPRWIQVCT